MHYMFQPIVAIIRYTITLPSLCYTSLHWECIVQVRCLRNTLML
jgi:hypothetical protein